MEVYQIKAKTYLRYLSLITFGIGIYMLTPYVDPTVQCVLERTVLFNPFFFLVGSLISWFITDWKYSFFISGPLLFFSLRLTTCNLYYNHYLPLTGIILLLLAIISLFVAGKNIRFSFNPR